MAESGENSSNYTVLQFSLETGPDQQPTQRSTKWGSYRSVEAAFEDAKCRAHDLRDHLQSLPTTREPTVIDTEWGYDLRIGPLTVHRLWVHENVSHRQQLP